MKEWILDYATWRCGGAVNSVFVDIQNPNALGTGITSLLNYEGFSCCLGQWCKQEGVGDSKLLDTNTPENVSILVNGMTELGDDDGRYVDTEFSEAAMNINDDSKTTPQEKIRLLTELCFTINVKLTVINQP